MKENISQVITDDTSVTAALVSVMVMSGNVNMMNFGIRMNMLLNL